ncbi:kelch-like protein 23 isoform X2 [Sardina pilchardus]|uniref:kelch-like protein 23 isoform X2 n=1 Tax=Sardina pilchardus TaxID=27697 RepID=UPI002E0E6FB0
MCTIMSAKGQVGYTYEFQDVSHPAQFLDSMWECYMEGLFTDVTLQCNNGQLFHCHRAALAARSPFFKVMFTVDMREKTDGLVRLPGIDSEVLGMLIEFMYTSTVMITQGNVEKLLEAADMLQVRPIKTACEEFLVRLLDVDNCLGMQAFAEHHACSSLEREAQRMVLFQFEELVGQEEFLEVSLERLRSILSTKNLNVRKQEVLVDALIKWVSHGALTRLGLTRALLHCINMDLDEKNFFRNILKSQRNCSNLSGTERIRSALMSSLLPGFTSARLSCKKPTASMYIVGGYHWHPLSEVHVWDPLSNIWAQGTDMPDHTRESYSIAQLGPSIYVTGGYRTDKVEALNTVWVYNSDHDEWAPGCPMLGERYYHCSVAMHGCVYAIGGYRGGAPTAETEFYDPLKKKWFPVANMIQGVGNATACVIHDTIYVTGGHYGYKGSCTYEKVQMYKADLNEWSIITTCPHPEYGLCSVSLNNRLYVVGGQTTVTDCYDPKTDKWIKLSNMKERRMECGAVAMNGCVYVTGGYSYTKGTYLHSMERFDPEQATWEIVGTLPSAARSHGCVCVYNL